MNVFRSMALSPRWSDVPDRTTLAKETYMGLNETLESGRPPKRLAGVSDAQEDRRRDGEVERLRGPEVRHQLELRWLLDQQVRGRCALRSLVA